MSNDDRTEVGASAVRQWARKRGLEVGSRGHLPQKLVDQYNRIHRKTVAVVGRNPWAKGGDDA